MYPEDPGCSFCQDDPFGCSNDPDPGPDPEPGRTRPIDLVTDYFARGELNTRLKNFSGSNCDKAFNSVIQGYSSKGLAGAVDSTEFYNVSNPFFAGSTQDDVSSNGSSTTLGNSIPFGTAAVTVGPGGAQASVLLGRNFFSNTNTSYQSNVLLHELLHAYTGWSDSEIFSAFNKYGLTNPNRDTEDISAWLSTDCTKTPTSLTWWK